MRRIRRASSRRHDATLYCISIVDIRHVPGFDGLARDVQVRGVHAQFAKPVAIITQVAFDPNPGVTHPSVTMYIPPSNAESRPEVLHDFMDAHPFATLVTASSDGLFATHLPLMLDRSRGPQGTLRGHIARANPPHKQMLVLPEALVIFSGGDAYITPTWPRDT